MLKLISSLLIIGVVMSAQTNRFDQYRSIAAYETKTGIQVIPVYSKNGSVCEVSLEKRAYYNGRVNVRPNITKEEIILIFDQLVPRIERGEPSWKLPEGSEFTEVDSATRATHIMYQNVSLVMYGEEHSDKYTVAIISWKKNECN